MFDKAILIGIQKYKSSRMKALDGVYEDINNISKLVVKFNEKVKIIKICDNNTDIKPTKENILRELKNIKDKRVLIYYSGHGSNVKTTNKDDYDKNYDQVMNVLNNKYISDNELNDVVTKNIGCNTELTVIMDCCHSGDILDLKYKFIDEFIEIRKINESKNKIVLVSGCAFTQYTVDAPKGGAFTGCLLKILEKYNYKITFKELYNELSRGLNYLKTYFGLAQEPQIFSSKKLNKNDYFINE